MSNVFAIVSPAVGTEIDRLFKMWSDKRDKVSKKFEDLFEEFQELSAKPVKKRKKGKKSDLSNDLAERSEVSNQIRDFASEEMIELYSKVKYIKHTPATTTLACKL